MSYKSNYQFYRTAESVSPKHPDKLCDRISDTILDAYLEKDPNARVACETCGGHGIVYIVGEITSAYEVSDLESLAASVAGPDCEYHLKIVHQSPEIARGVDTGGAGDQGIMIGYACDETPELMPLEVVLSRKLNKYIYEKYPYDGKTQVTLDGDKLISAVASFQNAPHDELEEIVREFIERNNLNADAKLFVNPAGDWNQGGFEADTGLTGRKLIVDNYGPRVPIGGGCFSGKDPSKVDRSAAYMARRVAVDYLRARKAHEVYVRLAYAIGVAEPLEQTVIIDGEPEQIEGYDLTPAGIIKTLDLRRPIYAKTASYGHFGEGFDWDK